MDKRRLRQGQLRRADDPANGNDPAGDRKPLGRRADAVVRRGHRVLPALPPGTGPLGRDDGSVVFRRSLPIRRTWTATSGCRSSAGIRERWYSTRDSPYSKRSPTTRTTNPGATNCCASRTPRHGVIFRWNTPRKPTEVFPRRRCSITRTIRWAAIARHENTSNWRRRCGKPVAARRPRPSSLKDSIPSAGAWATSSHADFPRPLKPPAGQTGHAVAA